MKYRYEMNKVGLLVFIILITSMLIDLGLVVFGKVNSSISAYIVGVIGPQAPWVVFCMGVLAGHLFFPVQRIEMKCGSEGK